VLKDLQARFGLRFRKALSQHFLIEPHTLERIAAATGAGPGDWIVEVGAGAGFLTSRLLRTGANVLAVEVDPAMTTMLKHVLGFAPRLTLVEDDLLQADVPRLLAEQGASRFIVAGNLPYHITSPALFRLLEWGREGGAAPTRLVVMVQREVGERLLAAPGGKTYGRLTVETAYAARCRKLFAVPPGAFLPRPKVHSVVLELTPHPPALAPAAAAVFHRLVREAFGQRRKTLANALTGLTGGRPAAEALLAAEGHPPGVRGERLSPLEFVRLAARWSGTGVTK